MMRYGLSGIAARFAIGVLAAALAAGGSVATAESKAAEEPLRVVASTTVLADLVAQTAGDLVIVSSLVPKGVEVHTFDPSPSDAVRIAGADLIVMNGLGLDDWLLQLTAAAGATDVPIVELAAGLEDVVYLSGDEHDGDAQPEHEGVDPHLWMDVANAARYVARVSAALGAIDPLRADQYASRAAAYLERLAALDAEVRGRLAAIPSERRWVVTLHEAFSYFAAAYGLEVVDAVITNPGKEPSAAELARLIDAMRAQGVSALLAETQFPDDLANVIAAEAGVPVVTGLYTDSLGDPPADTYEGMMRSNLELLVAALG